MPSSRSSPACKRMLRAAPPSTTSTPWGQIDHELEPVDGSPGAHGHRRDLLGIFERPLGVHLEGDLELWVSGARPDCEDEREGCRDDGELRPAERQRAEEPERGESGVSDQAWVPGAGHERAAGRTSSACGVGTLSSTSRTTSSALIRCTQSSGRRTSRCASAGTVIAFTSSGRT